MRVRSRTVVLLLLVLPAVTARAQVVQTHPARNTGGYFASDSASRAAFLPQAGLAVTETSPTVSVQALKYFLVVGRDLAIPFWILSTLPTLSQQDIRTTINSLLDEFGGLANVGLGVENKRLTIGRVFDFDEADRGLFLDLRGGAKLVGLSADTLPKSSPAIFAQALGSLRLALPINGADNLTSAGDVTGLLTVAMNYSSSRKYKDLFVDDPKEALLYLNLSGAINITGQFYLGGGVTLWTNEPQIRDRWFASLSLIPGR